MSRYRMLSGVCGLVLAVLLSLPGEARLPDYDADLFTKEEAIALDAAERHQVLAPNSGRSLPWPRPNQAWPSGWQRPARVPRPVVSRPLVPRRESHLSETFYSVTRATNGWMLEVRALPFVRSVLLLSEPIVIARGRTESYALRSTGSSQPVPHHLLYRGRLLGEEDGLFFLGSSTIVESGRFGKSFRVFIPDRIVFGYWRTAFDEWLIDAGVELRLRLYERRYSPADGFSRTYRIRIGGHSGRLADIAPW